MPAHRAEDRWEAGPGSLAERLREALRADAHLGSEVMKYREKLIAKFGGTASAPAAKSRRRKFRDLAIIELVLRGSQTSSPPGTTRDARTTAILRVLEHQDLAGVHPLSRRLVDRLETRGAEWGLPCACTAKAVVDMATKRLEELIDGPLDAPEVPVVGLCLPVVASAFLFSVAPVGKLEVFRGAALAPKGWRRWVQLQLDVACLFSREGEAAVGPYIERWHSNPDLARFDATDSLIFAARNLDEDVDSPFSPGRFQRLISEGTSIEPGEFKLKGVLDALAAHCEDVCEMAASSGRPWLVRVALSWLDAVRKQVKPAMREHLTKLIESLNETVATTAVEPAAAAPRLP